MHRICDTAIWGFRQSRQFDSILRIAAEAGFEGVETDFKTLAACDPGWLRGQFDLRGMTLAGVRTAEDAGGLLVTRGTRAPLDRVLGLMETLDARFLICRQVEHPGASRLGRFITALNRVAAECRDRGRRLLYMNGANDLSQEGSVLDAVSRDASADVGLCAAVGWLHAAGIPVITFLRDHRERLEALHLQDFAAFPATARDAVELGLGIVPLAKVTAWMRRSRLDGLWVVAEQAPAKGFPAQAVRRNGAFLIQELGRLGRETP